MTADLVLFRSRAELDAEANLCAFVDLARNNLTTFGEDLPFDENSWNLTGHLDIPGVVGKEIWMHFFRLSRKRHRDPIPLCEPFLSFAKAYVRYRQTLRPVKNILSWSSSLATLEHALAEAGRPPNPVDASPDVFDRAARLLGDRLSRAAAYSYGRQLEELSAFLVKHHLVRIRLRWKSFLPAPEHANSRFGNEFDERRKSKLPHVRALEAIAKVYSSATRPEDVLPSAIMALLICVCCRISEILGLPVDCEHWSRDPETGKDILRLRCHPAKGAEPMLKDMPPAMQDLAVDALRKIREITEPAREIARWYENNPGKIYLSPELEDLRQQEHLTIADVRDILGVRANVSALRWCRAHGLSMMPIRQTYQVRFDDVEQAVLAQLPIGFPYIPATNDPQTGQAQKYSERLFLIRLHEMHTRNSTSRCRITLASAGQLRDQMGSRTDQQEHSLFHRHNLTHSDGTPIRIRPHQIRHYLNTLALKGGMNQIDLALFSGRRHLQQNAAYDHVSADQMVKTIRDAVGNPSKGIGPLADVPEASPLTREEFAELRVPTALTTDAGFCINDFTMMPCQYHLNCIDCEEHVLVKNTETRSRIAALHDDAKAQLQKAQEATADGYAGANRWVDKHQSTVKRLGKARSLLEDPDIRDGMVIQLPRIAPPEK